jgi:hypothetical protein
MSKSKKPLSEHEQLLTHGCPTFTHVDQTGRPPEAVYEGSGHDRMDADVIAKANHNNSSNDGEDDKSAKSLRERLMADAKARASK